MKSITVGDIKNPQKFKELLETNLVGLHPIFDGTVVKTIKDITTDEWNIIKMAVQLCQI